MINMNNKMSVFIISCILATSCVGCESKSEQLVQVNVSDGENISSNQFGKFVDICGDFVYDSATRIVYRKNYTYGYNYVYIPYYAQNGFPYKYNPETNTFEEIENKAVIVYE